MSRSEAIEKMAVDMAVEYTDMYVICTDANGECERFTTEFIDYQKKRYEQAGIKFDIKEFSAGIMYNRLLNE